MPRALRSTKPAHRLAAVNYVPISVCCWPGPSASSKKLAWRNRQIHSLDVHMCGIPMTLFVWGRTEKTWHVLTNTILHRCFLVMKQKNTQINWVVRCVWKSVESNVKFNSELGLQSRRHQPRLATTCDRSAELYFIFGWYVRKTNKMHTFLNNLFHLIYPRHVSNK